MTYLHSKFILIQPSASIELRTFIFRIPFLLPREVGPLLCIIYVNDLPKSVSQDTAMAIFADDTKCYRPIKNSEDNKTLQSDLDNITT